MIFPLLLLNPHQKLTRFSSANEPTQLLGGKRTCKAWIVDTFHPEPDRSISEPEMWEFTSKWLTMDEHGHRNSSFTYKKWWCSIVMDDLPSGKLTVRPWKLQKNIVETRLPIPTTGRVELLIYHLMKSVESWEFLCEFLFGKTMGDSSTEKYHVMLILTDIFAVLTHMRNRGRGVFL